MTDLERLGRHYGQQHAIEFHLWLRQPQFDRLRDTLGPAFKFDLSRTPEPTAALVERLLYGRRILNSRPSGLLINITA